MISVLIVDDHTMVRETWSFILNNRPELGDIYECVNGLDAIRFVNGQLPGVILMDINMEPISGIEATSRILQSHPQAKILGISTHTDGSIVKRMMEAGAQGYVTKTSTVAEMVNAIVAVHGGSMYLCEELAHLEPGLQINKNSATA